MVERNSHSSWVCLSIFSALRWSGKITAVINERRLCADETVKRMALRRKFLDVSFKVMLDCLTSLCRSSSDQSIDAARSLLRCDAGGRYRSMSAAGARAAATQLHVAADINRRDRQTDGRPDTVPLHRRSLLEAGSSFSGYVCMASYYCMVAIIRSGQYKHRIADT